MNLESIFVPEENTAQRMSKDTSKGYISKLEGVITGQTWKNLRVKINSGKQIMSLHKIMI